MKSAAWPMIDPSTLRHQGQIQQQSFTHDISGGQSCTWATIATVQCSVSQSTHAEKATAEQLTAQCTHTVVMRWNPNMTVAAGMRILIKGGTYLVTAPDNVEERDIVLKVYCLSINQDSD